MASRVTQLSVPTHVRVFVLTIAWPISGRPVHGTATYRRDDTRDCIIQFCPPDDEHMCSKHVEA